MTTDVTVRPARAEELAELRSIDHVDRWAAGQDLPALTLSTFRSVAWNGPYYARLGFRELTAAELTPGLVEVLAEETAFGLDPAQRVFMRRDTGCHGVGPDLAGV